MVTPYYSDEAVTLYHGDCLNVMRELADDTFDLVFTSPPYNLGGFSGGWKGDLADGYEEHADSMPYPEYVTWQHDVLRECWRLIKSTGAIFYQHKNLLRDGTLRTPLDLIPEEINLRQIIVWDRGVGMNVATTHFLPVHELIYVLAGPEFRLRDKAASGLKDVWKAHPVMGSEHPAPFPLSLPAKAIEATRARSVLDPFAGSGTTLRAAANAGAEAVGIELTARYCDMAVARLAQGAFDFGEAMA